MTFRESAQYFKRGFLDISTEINPINTRGWSADESMYYENSSYRAGVHAGIIIISLATVAAYGAYVYFLPHLFPR